MLFPTVLHVAECCVLQCVACLGVLRGAVWYSLLQCVAIDAYDIHHHAALTLCCSVLQCVVVCCSVVQCGAVYCSMFESVGVCCSVLQCIAVHCSVLQCVAVCCSVVQCGAVCCSLV
jgi:hypothetical protein